MRTVLAITGFLSGLVASAVLWGVSASVAADDAMTSFTPKNVSAALQAFGAVNIKAGSDDEGPYVDYDYNGRKYRAGLHVCTGDSCKGLELICSFTGVSIPLEALNKFNVDRVFGKAIKTQEQTFRSERYVIADGGSTMDRLVAELTIHVRVTDYLLEQLRGAQLLSSVGGPGHSTFAAGPAGAGLAAPPPDQAQAHVRRVEPFANLIR